MEKITQERIRKYSIQSSTSSYIPLSFTVPLPLPLSQSQFPPILNISQKKGISNDIIKFSELGEKNKYKSEILLLFENKKDELKYIELFVKKGLVVHGLYYVIIGITYFICCIVYTDEYKDVMGNEMMKGYMLCIVLLIMISVALMVLVFEVIGGCGKCFKFKGYEKKWYRILYLVFFIILYFLLNICNVIYDVISVDWGYYSTGSSGVFAFATLICIPLPICYLFYIFFPVYFIFNIVVYSILCIVSPEYYSVYIVQFIFTFISYLLMLIVRYFNERDDRNLFHISLTLKLKEEELLKKQKFTRLCIKNILPKKYRIHLERYFKHLEDFNKNPHVENLINYDHHIIYCEFHPSLIALQMDIVGFSTMMKEKPPDFVVAVLNYLFHHFDSICEKFDFNKVKTEGDAYICVNSTRGMNQEKSAIDLGFEMIEKCEIATIKYETQIKIRVGVASSSGVIIISKGFNDVIMFDLFGDVMDCVEKLESTSCVGLVNVNKKIYQKVKKIYTLKESSHMCQHPNNDVSSYILEKKSDHSTIANDILLGVVPNKRIADIKQMYQSKKTQCYSFRISHDVESTSNLLERKLKGITDKKKKRGVLEVLFQCVYEKEYFSRFLERSFSYMFILYPLVFFFMVSSEFVIFVFYGYELFCYENLQKWIIMLICISIFLVSSIFCYLFHNLIKRFEKFNFVVYCLIMFLCCVIQISSFIGHLIAFKTFDKTVALSNDLMDYIFLVLIIIESPFGSVFFNGVLFITIIDIVVTLLMYDNVLDITTATVGHIALFIVICFVTIKKRNKFIKFYVNEKIFIEKSVHIRKEHLRNYSLILSVIPECYIESFFKYREKGEYLCSETEGTIIFFRIFMNDDNPVGRMTNRMENLKKNMEVLCKIFFEMDVLCSKNQCSRIKSTGYKYLACSGLNKEINHTENIATFALSVSSMINNLSDELKTDIKFKAGFTTDLFAFAVIGKNNFRFDVFGDSINLAARMMQTSEYNKIQFCGKKTFDQLFKCVKKIQFIKKDLEVHAKGYGKVKSYFLL